jgi:hypothetical protein
MDVCLALCFGFMLGFFQPSRTWDLGMLGCMFDFLLPMFTDLDCGMLGFSQIFKNLFGCC